MSFRLKAFWLHLLLSTLLLSIFATLVLLVWYKPWPLLELQGGDKILAMMMAIDVVLGPSLTLLVFKPEKSSKMLAFDMAVIFALQLLAFGYGAWTLQTERPVFLTFNQDTMDVVRSGDINLSNLPKSVTEPGFFQSATLVNIDLPESEKVTSILFRANNEAGFALHTEYYQPFPGSLTTEQLTKNALPFDEVMKNPETASRINEFLTEYSLKKEDCLLFPISGRVKKVIAVISKSTQSLLGVVDASI